MAERRMFAKSVICTDNFIDIPATAKVLYFYLMTEADDDGFVDRPRAIIRQIGSTDDDLKILLAKKYVMAFESGIVAIVHWKIHNYIRKDLYKPTKHILEREQVELINDKYSYRNETVTKPLQSRDEVVTLGKDRLGKDRLGKDRLGKTTTDGASSSPADFLNSVDKSVDNLTDNRFEEVLKLFCNNIQLAPSNIIVDDLYDLYLTYGTEWTMQAIKEATRQRGRSIKYISSILGNWEKRGSKTPWLDPKPKKQENINPQIGVVERALKILEGEENGQENSGNSSPIGSIYGSFSS